MRDIHLALRVLSRSPGLTAVALFSLALGIGANTAIFSLLNAVLLRPLPVPHPEQIVALATTISDNANNDEPFSWAMFEELSRQQQEFSDIFCWDGGDIATFEADGARFAASLAQASGTYYQAMGTAPLLGRYIHSADIAAGNGVSQAVAVISYRVWRNRFHGSLQILGQTIRIGNNHPFVVIGVEPEGFSGLSPDGFADVTVPLFSPGTTDVKDRHILRFRIFARLKPEAKLPQARAALVTLWPHIQDVTMPAEYDGEKKARFFARKIKMESAATGVSFLRKRFAFPLQVLMAIVGAVLLIACLNIANLSLAKAATHRHQSGVKAALGANTWDLIRPALVESLLLSFTGALLGLALSFWASRVLLNMAWTGYFPNAIDPSPDLNVLAFTAAIATLTGVLFGIVPAVYAARIDPIEALKQQSRTVRGSSNLFGKLLLVAQISLSLVLLLAAFLFGRTLSHFHSVDAGYRRDHLLTLVLFPQGGTGRPQDQVAYYRSLAERVKGIPGVERVSYSEGAPASQFEYLDPIFGSLSGSPTRAIDERIGPAFFAATGMHILAGRDFEWTDAGHDRAIISQSLAAKLFGQQNPIGRTIYRGPHSHTDPLTVIGVVNSASLWKVESVEPLAAYQLFVPDLWADEPMMVVRTTVDPRALKSTVEKAVEGLGHHYSLRTMTVDERLDSYITIQRLTALLSEFFGGVALLIACVGLYGLVSYHVTRRTTELGIRSALGAGQMQLLALVLREALVLASAGCLLGVTASLAAGRLIRSILFGISPADPANVAVALLIMLTVATAAAYLPARRAARIDPMTALRAE